MKIGLDFDGVISDCGKLKSDCAKMFFGVNIPSGLFKKDLVLDNGWLTPHQYEEITRAVYYSRKYVPLLEPVDGALSCLSRIIERGHNVLVITSRKEIHLEIAKEWSGRRGLALEFIGVGLHNSKAEAAAGLHVYVDDDLHKLEPLVGIVPNLFLFSWGYNQHFNESRIAVRVSSWKELYQRIEALGDI